jgi:hypothetical protein
MKESVKEPVLVNYYSQMRVQRVFPLSVDLQSVPGSLTGRVQIRPIIPGALVTPSIREVDLGPEGSSLNFSVTAMACGRLQHARLGIFQDGRHMGNVPLGMKGVRQLDSWVFLLLAILVPLLFYLFTIHLDWSRSAPAPPARVVVDRMPLASDTPVASNVEGRPPGAMQRPGGNPGAPPGGPPAQPDNEAGVENREASSLREAPPKLTGAVERSIVAEVPEFNGITRSIAAQMQDCYEIIQRTEKTYRISLYLGLGFLALALISGFVNRTTRTQRRSNLTETV